mgnify:FL=1
MITKASYNFTYGLFVVTARDAKDNGCISNTVGQVTTSPNRITFAVNKANLTHDMIAKTGEANISIISQAADFELFRRFGFQSGRSADKFDGLADVRRSKNGLYYITAGTNSWLSASVSGAIDLGTHTLFIAEVAEEGILSQIPSMSYDYYQTRVKPQPEKPKKTVWRCRICGYEYEGEELPADFVCPLCKHGAADFEKIEA